MQNRQLIFPPFSPTFLSAIFFFPPYLSRRPSCLYSRNIFCAGQAVIFSCHIFRAGHAKSFPAISFLPATPYLFAYLKHILPANFATPYRSSYRSLAPATTTHHSPPQPPPQHGPWPPMMPMVHRLLRHPALTASFRSPHTMI